MTAGTSPGAVPGRIPGPGRASGLEKLQGPGNIPADPFLTAFCCGIVLIAVIILFYIFIRFFLRKPPKAKVELVKPGTVERMPGPKVDAPPVKRRRKPPAPAVRSKTPPGPKWPPDSGDGPEQGS